MYGEVEYASGMFGGPVADDAAAGTFPNVSVEVAFTSNPGSENPVFVAVTADVRAVNITRGRQKELDRYQAGSCTVVLDNRLRIYDPNYSAGPHFGNILPMRRMRVQATYEGVTYPLFDGYIDSWDQEYVKNNEAIAVVSATDGFKPLEAVTLRSAYYEEVASDNPVAWWHLGEAAGATVAFDAVGTRDLTAVAVAPDVIPTFGVTGLVSREPDTAMQLVTPNNEGGVQRREQIISGGPLTMELIWKGTATELLAGQSNNAGDHGYSLLVNSGTGTVRFSAQAGGAFNPVSSTIAVNDGNTHHIVGVWQANGILKIYIDGVDRTATVVANPVGSFTAANLFIIGGGPWASTVAQGALGVYDEVAVYNTALSTVRIFAHDETVATPWSGDTPKQRIIKLLDIAEWPQNLRELDTGSSVLQSADIHGVTVLKHIQKVGDSEFGELFMTREGKVRLVGRNAVVDVAELFTFGDSGTELGYQEIGFDFSDQLIRNDVTVSLNEGVAQNVTDVTSITSFLRHSFVRDGLIHNSDQLSRHAAEFYVAQYKDPLLRVTDMKVVPAGSASTLFPAVLGVELRNEITVRRRPQGVGALIEQDSVVEGISHSIRPGRVWDVKWYLSPATADEYWQLGVAGFSELGETTRLYF